MKLKALFFTGFLFVFGSAQAGFIMGPSKEAKAEAFEVIVENVDETTAASLTTKQETVQSLMDELKALMDSEERDDDAIDTLREEIKSVRSELKDEVKTAMDENPDLKETVRSAVKASRAENMATRHALRSEVGFEQLISAANETQSASLESNKEQIDSLMEQMKDARDAGATREEMQTLQEQMMTIRDEQKAIVEEVLNNNTELKDTLIEDAAERKEDLRDRMKNRRELKE